MATAEKTKRRDGYVRRLKTLYESELRVSLKDELGLGTVIQVFRVEKITRYMGVGESK